MPQNGYSIGRDKTVVIILPDGSPLDLGKITGFTANRKDNIETLHHINDTSDHIRHVGEWSGSVSISRRNNKIDAYFGNIEANYYANIDEKACSIQETIQEANGSVSQWAYTKVILEYSDSGNWDAQKSVNIKINFHASTRVQVL